MSTYPNYTFLIYNHSLDLISLSRVKPSIVRAAPTERRQASRAKEFPQILWKKRLRRLAPDYIISEY